MKLALLIDDYVPFSTKVAAKMMHELACEFSRAGHDVTVITPGVLQDQKIKSDFIDGIEVIRFKSGPLKNCSFIKRAINETLLPFKAKNYLSNILNNKKFDLIVNYSPSIFWGYFARYLKQKNHCPVYLILRDFFPQWVIDNGMIKEHSLATKYFRFFEKINYQVADVIGIQSEANIKYFKSCFGETYITRLLYNWADPEITAESYGFREKYNLQGKIIFFYGGNIGKAQDMDNLVRLAEKMQNRTEAHFVFLGQGDEVELIQRKINKKSINNVLLLPPVSQEEFRSILKEIDVGLFSLSRYHLSHNFPGKILGYMVNGIPILGSVNPGNDLKSVVEKAEAGFISVNGEDELFYENALRLLNDSALRKKAGDNALCLLHEKFTVTAAAKEILSILIS
ncbi:MAG: glycosyltransferase family 4 protein [Mixta calida]|uniref:glycosyltransferase family 4 protein n=1 Tax=Mixta calida TaxID=665913 RepID=UPI002912148A|nr:glycosyltransferase family 4 protein [Mixta calida]MDU4940941.1 glycosyltransferase family 4 protein [Mixta calida]